MKQILKWGIYRDFELNWWVKYLNDEYIKMIELYWWDKYLNGEYT